MVYSFKRALRNANYNQTSFARYSGISLRQINRYAVNPETTPKVVKRLISLLELPKWMKKELDIIAELRKRGDD